MQISLTRPRIISAVTLVIGAVVLIWSLHITPGDSTFYLATALLAAVWFGGYAAARISVNAPSSSPATYNPNDVWLGIGVGAGLAAVFLIGAFFVTLIPALREPVEHLLNHADAGSFELVLALTLINGAAEEFFFRGALFDALRGHHQVATSTVIYTAVTAASGIWMLGLAGAFVGLATAILRVRTGRLSAPIAAHLTWSLGMIFLLPEAFKLWS